MIGNWSQGSGRGRGTFEAVTGVCNWSKGSGPGRESFKCGLWVMLLVSRRSPRKRELWMRSLVFVAGLEEVAKDESLADGRECGRKQAGRRAGNFRETFSLESGGRV